MVLLLVNQFPRKLECSSNVLPAQTVLTLHCFEAHAASEAADHQGDGHPSPTNDWLAMADARVNHDSVIHIHIVTLSVEFDQT